MWSPTHVQVTVQKAKGLLTKGKNKTNDCFVTIALGKEKYQTSVKEKVPQDVDWHEECELQIPEQGNKASIVLTALHRNFFGVDEFLGVISIPLSSFDIYERPKNRWYKLGSKPGKENTKERGELEVKIGFIVKAGSLNDLTKKERHKSSFGQLSTTAQSIGGSLLSIGSLEKRKGLKKLAKAIGSRVKGKSKNKIDKEDEFDELDEYNSQSTRQKLGEADPGVISEDEDEFTFDDLSHKSSASSLNAPVVTNSTSNRNSVTSVVSSLSFNSVNDIHQPLSTPSKPPRSISSSTTCLTKIDNNLAEDEWGQKLYGIQPSNPPKRWEAKPSPRIVIDQAKDEKLDCSPTTTPSPVMRFKNTNNTESQRDILNVKNKDENYKPTVISIKDKNNAKDEKLKDNKREIDRIGNRSPKEDKSTKKDKKKDKEQIKLNKDIIDENHPSSERIIIGGEDGMKNNLISRGRLPHEVVVQFEGKSREDLIEVMLQQQADLMDHKKRVADLEDYIDALLIRVMECSPRLLQNPYTSQRRLSSPGHQ